MFRNLSEYAKQFLAALKEKDDAGVKALLGKHAILTHRQCIAFKLKFVKGVHKASRYFFYILRSFIDKNSEYLTITVSDNIKYW